MAEVLSQQQIDELLQSVAEGAEIKAPEPEKKIKPYDFKTPKKFTKEQIKVLNGIFENYSRLLSSYLTGLLRLYCKVSLVQIEEQRYHEFNNALSDYVMMGMVDMGVEHDEIDETTIIYGISNPITFAMIDRLLGGKGECIGENRDFTEIEINLMWSVVAHMIELLKDPWTNYIEINPTLTSVETNSRVVQAIGPDEVAVIVVLEVEINEVANIISVCMPAINLENIMARFSGRSGKNAKKYDEAKDAQRRDTILGGVKETPLEIKAILSETQVDMYDILNLQVNDVIPLNMHIDSNVVLKVGGTAWFDGKLGVKNKRKAVKIDKKLRN